jgi:hypothetical protein
MTDVQLQDGGGSVGVFKEIKELHATRETVEGVARVIAMSRPTPSPDGDPIMRVKLNVSGAAIESYEVIASVPVPLRHVDDVVPGAVLPALIDRANPKDVRLSWDD